MKITRKLLPVILIGFIAAQTHSILQTYASGSKRSPSAGYSEIKQLFAGNTQENDLFGVAVAASGNTIAVSGAAGPGRVFIFERDFGGQDNWGLTDEITPDNLTNVNEFGGSIALDGDTLVVGAPATGTGDPGDPQYTGAAYVFERDLGGAGNWGQVTQLLAADGQEFDNFGVEVDIDGDTIVVGANQTLDNFGTVYVYERDLGGPSAWGESEALTASDGQSDDWFGSSVAIDGDTIAVGAKEEDGGTGNPKTDAGAVYLFERDLGGMENWGEAGSLHASDLDTLDLFGRSVSLSGDTLAVGATLEDGGPGGPIPNSGAVYIFERDLGGPGSWGEAAILHASDAQSNDAFGTLVALDGNTLVVSAGSEDGGPGDPILDAGAAYVFERNLGVPGSWGEAAKLMASNAEDEDLFGLSLAFDGAVIASGAPFRDSPPDVAVGTAYVFYRIETAISIYLPITFREP